MKHVFFSMTTVVEGQTPLSTEILLPFLDGGHYAKFLDRVEACLSDAKERFIWGKRGRDFCDLVVFSMRAHDIIINAKIIEDYEEKQNNER